MSEQTSHLVEGAYAAALDDTLWPKWTEQMRDVLGTTGATFGVIEADTGKIVSLVPLWAPRAVEEYLDHFGQFDPMVPVSATINGPCLYANESFTDERLKQTFEYMSWQRSVGLDYSFTAATAIQGSSRKVIFNCLSAPGTGPVNVKTRKTLLELMPDLDRAWRLGFEHNTML